MVYYFGQYIVNYFFNLGWLFTK